VEKRDCNRNWNTRFGLCSWWLSIHAVENTLAKGLIDWYLRWIIYHDNTVEIWYFDLVFDPRRYARNEDCAHAGLTLSP
jgi:hypothetical protein